MLNLRPFTLRGQASHLVHISLRVIYSNSTHILLSQFLYLMTVLLLPGDAYTSPGYVASGTLEGPIGLYTMEKVPRAKLPPMGPASNYRPRSSVFL